MVNLNAEVTTSFQDQAKKNTKEEHENGLMKTNKSFKKLDLRDYDYAEFKYEMLQNQIRDFQNSLSDEFDVCVKFISYGNKIIQIENISYQNPDLLYFYGYLDKKNTDNTACHSIKFHVDSFPET